MDIDPHIQFSKFTNKNSSPLESTIRHHQYTGSRMEKLSNPPSPVQTQQKYTLPVMVQNINGGTFSRALSTAPNDNSNNNNNNNTLNIITIDQKFKVGRKIGSGNFGEIRIGKNTVNNENVAIKFEKSSHSSLLHNEYKFYKILETHEGLPSIHFFGQCNQHNALVMELLGPSLEDMFNLCDRRFTPKTVSMIAIQILKITEYVHSKQLIFRDIKPENFLIGRQSLNKHRTLYMIDFGLAKEYVNPKTNKHIPYCENKSLTGTARYMSINTHLGREQSRRDDLEAIAHMLFYFLRGKLPWQGLQADSFKERYKKIGEVKQKTNLDDLTQGYPKEFGDFLKYCRELEFLKTPDYRRWINKFEDLMRKRNWWSPNDESYNKWDFDWVEKLNQTRTSKNNNNNNIINSNNNNNNGPSSIYSAEISDIKNFKYQKNLKETYNRVLQNYNKTQVLNNSNISTNNNNNNNISTNNTSSNKAKLPFLSNSFNNNNISSINYLKPSVESTPVFKKEPNFCKVLKEKFRTKFQNQKVTTTATPIKILNSSNNNISTITTSNSFVPKFNLPSSRNGYDANTGNNNSNHNINLYSSSIIKTSNYPITGGEQYTSQYTHSSPNFYYNYNFADSNHVPNSYYDNLDKYKL